MNVLSAFHRIFSILIKHIQNFIHNHIQQSNQSNQSTQPVNHFQISSQFSAIIAISAQSHNQKLKSNKLTMSPPRRALIAITSAKATLFQGKETTGLFISEALHPYDILVAAGFEVDLASETGTYSADWLSQQPDFLNGSDLATWNDVNSSFRQKLDNMPKASTLDGSKYGVFFASAGHAALIDYPTASGLQNIAARVWANGGIVSSVCHGPAIFANILDPVTKEPIIKGKKITGFTTEAEHSMGIYEELVSWNSEMMQDVATRLGATCKYWTFWL